MSTCTTPRSWLVLERYHLGELPPSEHDAVLAHLRDCAACASALEHISADDARALAPLQGRPLDDGRSQASLAVPALASEISDFAHGRRGRVLAIASGLALAAVVVLAIGRRSTTDPSGASGSAKGGAVSFVLVRDDDVIVAETRGSFRDGQRFKAVVSCHPATHASFDLVVYDGRGGVTFPLPVASDVPCGNSVALPGAFQVTGSEPLTVCLAAREDGTVDRAAIRAAPPISANAAASCKVLEPGP